MICLVIGWNRLVIGIKPLGAVKIELNQSYREQLHQLACIVFVRANIEVRIRLLIAEHTQVDTHGRMQRDFLQEVAVVAERVSGEHVVVIGNSERPRLQRSQLRDNQNFRQRKCDTLAQLVLAPQ